MAFGICSRELVKVLTTPSKIASALDWKKQISGTIATMDVHTDRIGLTITSHPSITSNSNSNSNSSNSSSSDEDFTATSSPRLSSLSLSSLSSSSSFSYSVPLRSKGIHKIPVSSRHQLSEIVQEHKVCGFIVCWPIQYETGRMGASCGRTLFAIEQLLQQPQSSQSSHSSDHTKNSTTTSPAPIFTQNRKLCLWDATYDDDASHRPHHHRPHHRNENNKQKHKHRRQRPRPRPTVDSFGRSSVYAHSTSDQNVYCASTEQYYQDESIVALQIWNDFVHTCWPHLSTTNHNTTHQQQLEHHEDEVLLEEYPHPRQHKPSLQNDSPSNQPPKTKTSLILS